MFASRRLTFNVAVGLMALVVLPGCQGSKAPPPPSGPSKSVGALARLQPGDGVINVGVAPGERLLEVLVHENDSKAVSANQLLARLGSYPLRKAEHDLAVSQRDEARSQLAAIRANGAQELAQAKVRRQIVVEVEPLDIKAQKDKVAYLEKQLTTARDNLSRLQSLEKGTVPAQQLEQNQLVVSQAESELDAARSLLDKAVRGHDLNVQAADAQLRVIEATLKATEQKIPLESLERTVAVAAERLTFSEVRAPAQPEQMVVLEVLGRPGELTKPDVRRCRSVRDGRESYSAGPIGTDLLQGARNGAAKGSAKGLPARGRGVGWTFGLAQLAFCRQPRSGNRPPRRGGQDSPGTERRGGRLCQHGGAGRHRR